MKAGYDEQAPELNKIGAGIQLSANAMHVLKYLGLGEDDRQTVGSALRLCFSTPQYRREHRPVPLADDHERLNGAPLKSTSSC